MAIYVKFTDTELKNRITNYIKTKLERAMMDKGGFSGVLRTDLKKWMVNAFPDVSDTMLLEIYTGLKTNGIIEEVTV